MKLREFSKIFILGMWLIENVILLIGEVDTSKAIGTSNTIVEEGAFTTIRTVLRKKHLITIFYIDALIAVLILRTVVHIITIT